MPTIKTTGPQPTELYYTDSGGKGRPIVLIHGWPSSGKAWENIEPVLQEAGLRTITYDRRGFGRSGQPSGGYDYDTFAADLDDLMRELDLIDACLVGFSMGGGEVARYIGNYGTGRITAAAFVAAIPPCLDAELEDNPEGAFNAQAASEMQAGLTADRTGFLTGFLNNFYSIPLGQTSKLMVDQQVLDESMEIASQAKLEALSASIKLWLTDFRQDLTKFSIPTLVIHGEGDQIVPIQASGARVAKDLRNAELIAIPDGPHGLLASHTQRVAEALVNFLT